MPVTGKRQCTKLLPLVLPAQAGKDLATPRTADSTMLARLRKRRQRKSRSIALHMTQAMRARMQLFLPNNASKKCRFIWRRVRQPRLRPPDL